AGCGRWGHRSDPRRGPSLGQLRVLITGCHVKAADSAFHGRSFDEDGCKAAAKGKFDAAVAKVAAKVQIGLTVLLVAWRSRNSAWPMEPGSFARRGWPSSATKIGSAAPTSSSGSGP